MVLEKLPDAFIFDMDGVIIDSEPLHSQAKLDTFAHFGLDFAADDLPRYMGRTSKELFREALARNGQATEKATAMAAYKHGRYQEILAGHDDVAPIAGVRELIISLAAARVPLALASSSWRPAIDAVLGRFALGPYFKAVLSGDDVAASKPNPEIYLLAAKGLGVDPAGCLVLEDTANGIAAAKAAGMGCIAYRNPLSGRQDLSQADYVVDSIADIAF